MTDQELWERAVAAVQSEYASLPTGLRRRVAELAAEIAAIKTAYQQLATTVDVDAACARCRGLCCGHGKHHFTVVDLLGYLTAGQELFTPSFSNPVCPYHNGCGCLMAPGFRPLNCIIFLCDQLDDLLPAAVSQELVSLEKELRRLYRCLELLLGSRFANGLLITCERAQTDGGRLFNY